LTLTQQLHTASLGIYIILGLLLAAPAAAAAAAAAAISITSLPPIALSLFIWKHFCSFHTVRNFMLAHPLSLMWESNDDGDGVDIVWRRWPSLLFATFGNLLPMTAGFGFWVLGFGFWVLGFGFWVLGFGFWVLGFGFGIRGV
jgi:hypothetical protein